MTGERGSKGHQARPQPAEQHQAQQRRGTAPAPQCGHPGPQLRNQRIGRWTGAHRLRCGARENHAYGAAVIATLHSLARARDDHARDRCLRERPVGFAPRRVAQRRDAECGQSVITQEETQQMQQVGDAVVDGRGGHQQHAASYHHTGQRAVAIGLGIAEAVGLVNYNKGGGRGR